MLNYNTLERYEAIQFIIYEVNLGWLFKIVHSNNASVIFLLLYMHLYKNLSVFGYRLHNTWNRGILIILLIIGAAFSGYVLVGSQIRFWAAIVITRLLSVVPLNGEKLLYIVWRGYRIRWVTYQTLLVVHFILPFLVIFIILFHLNFLHASGRTSPYFSHTGLGKIRFYPYYWTKDLINIAIYLIFLFFMFLYPYVLGEVELFEEANSINSPVHIMPEWYFCAQYAILRRVPSKGFGVILMFLRIVVLFFYPLSISYITPPTGLWWVAFFEGVFIQIWLIFLGIAPIAQPYIFIAQIRVLIYFFVHFSLMALNILSTYYFKV